MKEASLSNRLKLQGFETDYHLRDTAGRSAHREQVATPDRRESVSGPDRAIREVGRLPCRAETGRRRRSGGRGGCCRRCRLFLFSLPRLRAPLFYAWHQHVASAPVRHGCLPTPRTARWAIDALPLRSIVATRSRHAGRRAVSRRW